MNEKKYLSRIVDMVSEKTGSNKEAVEEMIYKKQKELGGLVTEIGAAYMVARDNGIKIDEIV